MKRRVWIALFGFAALIVGPLSPGLGSQSKDLEQTGLGGRSDRAAGTVGKADTATSSVSGAVSSAAGARLPGALITLTDPETGTKREVVSGARGLFRITDLGPGLYQVVAELHGFETFQAQILDLRTESRDRVLGIRLQPSVSIHDQVTVVGHAPANSLESSEIRESAAKDLGEALTRRAGLWKIRKGGIANDVVMRGFQGRDLNVLIDGERVYGACPNNMDPAAFHVDFAEVDRVDIAKGPFDVRNQGGLGGSINVVTRRPERGFSGHFNLSSGAFGYLNPSLSLAYADDAFSVLGGYSYRSGNPYRDGSGRPFTDLTNYAAGMAERNAYEIGSAWGRLGVNLSDNQRIEASYARQQADDVLYPYLMMDAVYDDTNRVGLRYDVDRPAEVLTRLSVHAYYTDVSHWMTDQFRQSGAAGPRGYAMGTMAATRTFGARVETATRAWTFGVETYQRYWGAFTEMAMMQYRPQFSIPGVDMVSVGAFADYLKPLNDYLVLTGGFRMDRIRSSADPQRAARNLYLAYHGVDTLEKKEAFPSGYSRIQLQTARGFGMGIGVGTTVQVPEPTELFFGLKRMGSDWVGNPSLDSTRNNSVDVSFRFQSRPVLVELGLYHDWVRNFITLYDQERLSMQAGVMNTRARTYTNVDARLYGGELELVVPLADRLFLSGDVSWVRGVKDMVPEKQLLSRNLSEIPPMRSRLALRYDDARWFASVETVYSNRQSKVDADLGEAVTPPYALVNLEAGLHRKGITAALGVVNLLDRTYSEHLSYQRDPFRSGVRVTEPGRSFFVNLGYAF